MTDVAATAAPIPAVTSAPDTPAVAVDSDPATVLVGPASAKVTVDLYEDFLCPVCRQFEQTYGGQIHTKLTAGAVPYDTFVKAVDAAASA